MVAYLAREECSLIANQVVDIDLVAIRVLRCIVNILFKLHSDE
jgi:hypothetical protein